MPQLMPANHAGGEGQEPESEQAVSSVPVDPGSTAGRRHTGNPPDAEPARQSAGGVGAPLSPTTVTGDTPMLDASSAEIGTSGHAGNTAELSRFDAAVSTPVAADPGTQIPDAGGSDQKGPYQSAPSQPGGNARSKDHFWNLVCCGPPCTCSS